MKLSTIISGLKFDAELRRENRALNKWFSSLELIQKRELKERYPFNELDKKY